MPSTGGEPRELYRFEEQIDLSSGAPITWTADGKHILFSIDTDDPKREFYRIPAEGGEPESLGLEASGFIINLAVHPDGRQIAFSTSEHSDSEIWVMENFLPELKAEK